MEFYFNFSSPYGYIASEKIDALAARYGRLVSWRPFLLGVAFKTTGGAPLLSSEVATKEGTRMEVEAGLAKGVFGSPYIIVDGEPFWGTDRLDQVEKWLASGGF